MRRRLLLVLLLLSLLAAMCGASDAFALISTGDGGWVWQNPLPQGDQITAVDFVDSGTGWAVGGWLDAWAMRGHGVVLQTRDGGLTWSTQYRGSHRLNAICFVDAGVGWAVGDGGTIIKTTDGGETWQAQPSHTAVNLASVDFVDAENGWAVAGPRGIARPDQLVIHTADGGATWEVQLEADQLPDDRAQLYAVDFVSATTGWAVGSEGLIVKTTDGGVTWTVQESGIWPRLSSVAFLDASTGWAAGDVGTILRTVDGGVTWSPQAAGTSEGLTALTFVSPTSGWAVGDHGVVLRTVDAGSTWVAQESGTTTGLTDVDFVSPTEGWTGGESLHTTTAGAVWSLQSPCTTRQDLSSVDFVDLLTGWAVGAAGTIVHTADAGVSWAVQASGTSETLSSVEFVDARNGWAVGGTAAFGETQRRIILHTRDGGLTWEAQLDTGDPPLDDVQFVDCRSGWAVGDNGTILHTGNGGTTWSPQDSGTTAHLVSLSFVGISAGWAVAADGAMVRTTDGGVAWEPQAIPLDQDAGGAAYIGSIEFLGERTGWAAGGTYGFTPGGNWGQLYRTTDGGATWQELMRFDGPLTSVSFLDDTHGWVVGDYGTACHTSDGGTTWQSEETGAGRLDSVGFVSATDGWIVGTGGAILHTVTGGLPDGGPGVAPSSATTFTFAPDATSDWHDIDQTVALTASGGGAARAIHYSLDGGATWAVSVGDSIDVVVSSEGSHHLQYFASDAHETETPHDAGYVNIDKTAPVTTAAGADADWHRRPVTVTLDAVDSLSGAQMTESRIDARPWRAGTAATVKAPRDHSWDGVHTVYYRAADNAGNVEATKSMKVRIDTKGPGCSATAAAGAIQGSRATLHYRVNEARSPKADVTIKVRTLSGKLVKSYHIGWRDTDEALTCRIICSFSPKTYRYLVYARDLAGNTQSHIGANTLTVHPRPLSRSLGAFR